MIITAWHNRGKTLILLGAGATAAISDGTLPTSDTFFSSNNSTWSSSIADYPHLAAAHQGVAALKYRFENKTTVSLTDVWLFLDTLLKYHSATSKNNEYDHELLRIRYDNMGEDIPVYLRLSYLNTCYSSLVDSMKPLFSPLRKRIYDTFPQNDAVSYFLVMAGWELKHLLYTTYDPLKELPKSYLYRDLLNSLHDTEDIAVISFNYDTYFERSCGKLLNLIAKNRHTNAGSIAFCKPHGGWNIRHVGDKIIPFCSMTEFIEETAFDRLAGSEERPAMIPYFSYPDEIKDEHQNRYPGVGDFFCDQSEQMKNLFQDAQKIVSIGYSFSKDDKHVRSIVSAVRPDTTGRGKKLLCALKGSEKKKDIMDLWKFSEQEEGKTIYYNANGFDKSLLKIIKAFLEN
jgi:hypothetical protein